MCHGFTLIELMVAVAIVAVLTAIALPGYTQHIRKSRRAEAKTALLDFAARQERFLSTNNVYTSAPDSLGYVGAFPVDVLSGSTVYYRIDVTLPTSTSFSATAAPTGAQAGDTCGTYTLNQLGVQGNTGNTTATADCW